MPRGERFRELRRAKAGDKTIVMLQNPYGGITVSDELREGQEDYTIYRFFSSDELKEAKRYFNEVVKGEKR